MAVVPTSCDPNAVGNGIAQYIVLSNNNLTVQAGPDQPSVFPGGTAYGRALALEYKTSGLFYWEVTVEAFAGGGNFGLCEFYDIDQNQWWGVTGDGHGAFSTNHSTLPVVGDVWGFALKLDEATQGGNAWLWFRINGVWNTVDPTTPGASPDNIFGNSTHASNCTFLPTAQPFAGDKFTFNFGATAYRDPPPDGFVNWTRTYGYVGSVACSPPTDLTVDPFSQDYVVPHADYHHNEAGHFPNPDWCQVVASKFTFPACEVASIDIPIFDLNNGNAEPFTYYPHYVAVIYTDVSGAPGTLVAQSDPHEIGNIGTASIFDWGVWRLPISATLTAGDYWIGIVGDLPIGGGTIGFGFPTAAPTQFMSYLPNGLACAVNGGGLVPDATFSATTFMPAQLRIQARLRLPDAGSVFVNV